MLAHGARIRNVSAQMPGTRCPEVLPGPPVVNGQRVVSASTKERALSFHTIGLSCFFHIIEMLFPMSAKFLHRHENGFRTSLPSHDLSFGQPFIVFAVSCL